MPRFKLMATWDSWAVIYVEADTLEDAIVKAYEHPSMPLGSYVDDSFGVEPFDGTIPVTEYAPLKPR